MLASRNEDRLWDVQTLTEEKGVDMRAQIRNAPASLSLSFDDVGFLCQMGERLVWLPAINRGEVFAKHGRSTFAVGRPSGSVTIIRLKSE
jgi:hypothetical protein